MAGGELATVAEPPEAVGGTGGKAGGGNAGGSNRAPAPMLVDAAGNELCRHNLEKKCKSGAKCRHSHAPAHPAPSVTLIVDRGEEVARGQDGGIAEEEGEEEEEEEEEEEGETKEEDEEEKQEEATVAGGGGRRRRKREEEEEEEEEDEEGEVEEDEDWEEEEEEDWEQDWEEEEPARVELWRGGLLEWGYTVGAHRWAGALVSGDLGALETSDDSSDDSPEDSPDDSLDSTTSSSSSPSRSISRRHRRSNVNNNSMSTSSSPSDSLFMFPTFASHARFVLASPPPLKSDRFTDDGLY